MDPEPGHERYVGRLAIPYLCEAGVRTFRFRVLGTSGPKYIGVAGARSYMYNPSGLLVGGDTVAICEGELDTVVCHSMVGIPAVGVPGVSNWKPHFGRMFAGVPRVIVFADNDEKEDGRNPGQELADRICAEIDRAVAVAPPKGLDLTEWVLRDGPEAVREAAGLWR